MTETINRQEIAFEALNVLTRAGCDFADVFIEENQMTRIKIEASRPDQIIDQGEFGAGLRLVRGDATFFASTNEVTSQGLRHAACELIGSIEGAAEAASRAVNPRSESRPAGRPPTLLPLVERIELAMEAEKAARGSGPLIRQVTVMLNGFTQRIGIARSDDIWCEDQRIQVMLGINVVAGRDNVIQTGYEAIGGARGWEFFHDQDPGEVGMRAGRRANMLLTARPAPSGRMTVVLASEAGGTMIHEAIGHSLEGDLIRKGLSPFGDKIGKSVASPLICVVDDATLEGWRGSYGLDDEGSPAVRTLLVERGILLGFMHDILSARLAGGRTTGNGRRQSYAYAPIPRMSNTMILPGKSPPEDIIKSVSKGLYVVRMGGGQVNTVNGDFVFEINEGYIIRDGEPAEPVRGATLIGNGQQVLKSIDMVGTDCGMGIGTCGKDEQGVPVADAQPTLRIPEITVGGSGE